MRTGYRSLKPAIPAVVLTGRLAAASPLRAQSVAFPGLITTVAGTGTAGYTGEGGPAISADLKAPQGAAVDGAGSLFIAGSPDNRVRVVNTQAPSAPPLRFTKTAASAGWAAAVVPGPRIRNLD
jgi:hypothetical protein